MSAWRLCIVLLIAGLAQAGVALSDLAPSDVAHVQPQGTPRLAIEAPESLQAVASRLARYTPERVGRVMRLVGLRDPGDPVRVVLVPAGEPVARQTPEWIAGFAVSRDSLIVLFPGRIPTYPDDTLEEVLDHELAHVLIHRAAEGGTIPRWFNEGVAMLAEANWGLRSRARIAWELAPGYQSLDAINEGFAGGRAARTRAYALSAAIVRDLHDQHGPDLTVRVLAEVRGGASFGRALWRATGQSPAMLEDQFWSRHRPWQVWLLIVTDPRVLWIGVALLAVLAFWRHRRRRAARRRRWDDEERALEEDAQRGNLGDSPGDLPRVDHDADPERPA